MSDAESSESQSFGDWESEEDRYEAQSLFDYKTFTSINDAIIYDSSVYKFNIKEMIRIIGSDEMQIISLVNYIRSEVKRLYPIYSPLMYGANKPFLLHWGEPPVAQTRDYIEWPNEYGHGSSTVAEWIQHHIDEDKANASVFSVKLNNIDDTFIDLLKSNIMSKDFLKSEEYMKPVLPNDPFLSMLNEYCDIDEDDDETDNNILCSNLGDMSECQLRELLVKYQALHDSAINTNNLTLDKSGIIDKINEYRSLLNY